MKLTALAVTALFISVPALAQGYGTPDASSNSSAAVPATPATPSANSNDDTRVASNQAKHRQHKKSSTSTDQMSTSPSQASPSAGDASPSQSAPAPQQ